MALWSTIRAFFTAGKGVFGGLSEEGTGDDPLSLFHTWFQEAIGAGIYLPESMALGTASPDGKPSVRLVLLKGYDERGFVFFTNYESRKAAELEANPEATLVFHWAILQRQIRLEGTGPDELPGGVGGLLPLPSKGKPGRGVGITAEPTAGPA